MWTLTPFNIPLKTDDYGGHQQAVHIYVISLFTVYILLARTQHLLLSENEKMPSPHIFFFQKNYEP